MYKHILSPRQRTLDIIACAHQLAPQIRTSQIQNIHFVDLELQALGSEARQLRDVVDLDKMTDVEVAEKPGVERGGKGAEVEDTAGRTARDDLVNGCAHGLHDLWGHMVQSDHAGRGKGRGRGEMVKDG
jgi:hypothetical protein